MSTFLNKEDQYLEISKQEYLEEKCLGCCQIYRNLIECNSKYHQLVNEQKLIIIVQPSEWRFKLTDDFGCMCLHLAYICLGDYFRETNQAELDDSIIDITTYGLYLTERATVFGYACEIGIQPLSKTYDGCENSYIDWALYQKTKELYEKVFLIIFSGEIQNDESETHRTKSSFMKIIRKNFPRRSFILGLHTNNRDEQLNFLWWVYCVCKQIK